jgi:mycofactocin radical SAM maturase
MTAMTLVEQFEYGLDAPICLTWELTYACNLSCVHCLSSSGRRDPRELTTEQCEAVIDELQRMQVFYVNIGGGEPTVRPDFWHLLEYAVAHQVGVKFSTNGVRITPERAAFLASTDYVDVQVSLDGATAEVNDAVRGTTLASSTSSSRSPTGTVRPCGSPGCGPAAAARTCGTSCTPPRPSSASSTNGCLAPATTC